MADHRNDCSQGELVSDDRMLTHRWHPLNGGPSLAPPALGPFPFS